MFGGPIFAWVRILRVSLYFPVIQIRASDGFAIAQSTDDENQISAFKMRQNQILAALPDADMKQLVPYLEPILLPVGMTLGRSGENAANVYFPGSGVAGFLQFALDGEITELALTGREGLVGIESFLGGKSMPMDTVVLCVGHGYRIKATRLIDAFYNSDSLRRILLRYGQSFLTQIEQTAVCNRHHAIEQRLCRFLLHCLDRLSSSELVLTQDLIANMLGVRREGVTDAARKLRHAGLIKYHRGHINVIDRMGLESRTCECYTVVKKEYDRLAPQPVDGKSAKIHSAKFAVSSAFHSGGMRSA